jgi:hypothetical protein
VLDSPAAGRGVASLAPTRSATRRGLGGDRSIGPYRR